MSNRWNKTNGVVWEELGAETLLVQPGTGASWRLNSVAALVWKHCNGATSIADMARAFGSSELRRIDSEISAFCRQLETAGLLTPAPVPALATSQQLNFSAQYFAPRMTGSGLGSGPRRRPTPRGVSGPG